MCVVGGNNRMGTISPLCFVFLTWQVEIMHRHPLAKRLMVMCVNDQICHLWTRGQSLLTSLKYKNWVKDKTKFKLFKFWNDDDDDEMFLGRGQTNCLKLCQWSWEGTLKPSVHLFIFKATLYIHNDFNVATMNMAKKHQVEELFVQFLINPEKIEYNFITLPL